MQSDFCIISPFLGGVGGIHWGTQTNDYPYFAAIKLVPFFAPCWDRFSLAQGFKKQPRDVLQYIFVFFRNP